MQRLFLSVCLLGALLVSASVVVWAQGDFHRVVPLGLDLYMPVPEDNSLTVEKVALGRLLFSDTRLSRDGAIACASCHDPQRAFSSPQPIAVGVFGRHGHRNAPALINRGYGRAFFWDGRIPTLEEQVLQPIQDPNEMDMTLEEAASRVGLDVTTLSQSLASYVRTILSGDSPYDRFINGDRAALTADEQAGLQIFRGKGNCTACHVGPNFSDEKLHNTGVAFRDGQWLDPGRLGVTGQEEDRGAFKTPTLREVARTAPYMHDGSLATLEEVIDFYDGGGNANPHLDPELRPLRLSVEEKKALVAFLHALSGTVHDGN
jgi:cytochrome c peroxidase